MLYVHSEIVIILNRGVLWLRKREAFIGFVGKWETRQCIINNNKFHNRCSTWLHICLMPLKLSSFLYFFFYSFTSITLSPSVCFFFPAAWLCWHLHSSVSEWKKDKRFFSCCVVSDSFLSPSCVLCLLSHQWNIEESTEHVSNPHVCCWVVLQGRLFSPLQFGGAVCSCVWIMSCACLCVCVCLFLVSRACNPLDVNSHERS